MAIQQLSVFIENKSGTLVRVLDILKNEGIQIIASTIADTTEYGIYRLICDKSAKAFQVLKDAGIAVTLSEVLALQLDDTPGRAADAIKLFAGENISIAYMYSFLLDGKGILIFRTDNPEKAMRVIKDNNLSILDANN